MVHPNTTNTRTSTKSFESSVYFFTYINSGLIHSLLTLLTLIMRLTAQIVQSAPSYINTLGDRTLSLRGLQLPLLENTEGLSDIHTTLDLTNNDLRSLNGSSLPCLARLKCVLAADNRISSIHPDLAQTLPHLTTLSLVNNSLGDFKSLQPLQKCIHLTNIYLVGNPVCSKDHYREFILWLLPFVKVLDFEKVTKREVDRAREVFGTHDEPTPLAQQLLSITDRVAVDVETVQRAVKLTEEEKAELKEQLKKATSLVEIDRIETILKTGNF